MCNNIAKLLTELDIFKEAIMNDYEIDELLNRLKASQPLEFFAKIDKSNCGMGLILAFLNDKNDYVMSREIASKLNVSTARVAVLLRKMEAKSLIEKKTPLEDMRKTLVKLTDYGKEYVEQLKNNVHEKAKLLFEKVGQNNIEELIRVSELIKNNLYLLKE